MELAKQLPNAALAFRGYNVTNLGRSAELLANSKYRPVVVPFLQEAAEVCTQCMGRPVDLVRRVEMQQETELQDYAEAIAIVVAIEQAQLITESIKYRWNPSGVVRSSMPKACAPSTIR